MARSKDCDEEYTHICTRCRKPLKFSGLIGGRGVADKYVGERWSDNTPEFSYVCDPETFKTWSREAAHIPADPFLALYMEAIECQA